MFGSSQMSRSAWSARIAVEESVLLRCSTMSLQGGKSDTSLLRLTRGLSISWQPGRSIAFALDDDEESGHRQ